MWCVISITYLHTLLFGWLCWESYSCSDTARLKNRQCTNQSTKRSLAGPTGWRRPIGSLIFIRHFPQKSPIISGSFAESDLQVTASYGFSPPCTIYLKPVERTLCSSTLPIKKIELRWESCRRVRTLQVHMGWLRLVGSLKIQVSFAEYRLFYRALLQKRPVIFRCLLTEATPYSYMNSHMYGASCQLHVHAYASFVSITCTCIRFFFVDCGEGLVYVRTMQVHIRI